MVIFLSCLIELLGDMTLLTAYITGGNSFPQPLSEKEERYYLNKLKDGDLIAKNVLVERNLRLVAHIVKKYSYSYKGVDDLISIGTVGLIKAIDSFDCDKGTRLATYAARCIENEILMFIRHTTRNKSEVFLQDPIGIDKEGNEISLMDVLSSEEESIIDIVENKIQVKRLYKEINESLKEREKLIIQLRYGLNNGKPKTQREIAKLLGISRSYVSRIEKRALRKLNKELNNPAKCKMKK